MALAQFKIPDQIEFKFAAAGATLAAVFLQSIVGVKDGDLVISSGYHRDTLDPESPEATAALGAALQAALATVIPLQNQVATLEQDREALRQAVQEQAARLANVVPTAAP